MTVIEIKHGICEEAEKLRIQLHPGLKFSRLALSLAEFRIAGEADKGEVGNVRDDSKRLLGKHPQSLLFCVSSLTSSVINRIKF